MNAVRCNLGKSQNQLDRNLAQKAGAIRFTVNRSTGFTTNQLILGGETNHPAELVFPLPPSVSDRSLDEYLIRALYYYYYFDPRRVPDMS